MAAVDTSSDWNAPAEHWGNYEEPPVLVTAATLSKPKEQPATNKVLCRFQTVDVWASYDIENKTTYTTTLIDLLCFSAEIIKSLIICFCCGRYRRMKRTQMTHLGEQPSPRGREKRRRQQRRRLHLMLRQEKNTSNLRLYCSVEKHPSSS